MNSELYSIGVLVGKLELIGRVNFDFHFESLDRRSRQPQRLRSVASLGNGLDLQAARERVWVVLQSDDAQNGPTVGVEQHDAALEETGGIGEGGHCLSTS